MRMCAGRWYFVCVVVFGLLRLIYEDILCFLFLFLVLFFFFSFLFLLFFAAWKVENVDYEHI